MGLPSDAEELMGKAVVDVRHKKRVRVFWAIATSLGTIVATTVSVTRTVDHYLHKAELREERMSDALEQLKESVKRVELKADAAKENADKALLYAQLKGLTP